ncbi:MAG: hypothetical protein H8M99_15145 [Gloeobacteraceae cyanobacterium ES-bin-144]|nr:hypothetical protein [Verrucomicrobiales bacterium]
MPGKGGENINGPSLIRVPDWVPNRLGFYYLYFAHHSGKSIRLAYSDKLEGPWKIYKGGVLQLDQVPSCKGHIASPDVHVDESRKEIRLYFHGPAKEGGGQKSFLALSPDGLKFKPLAESLGISYFRVFQWRNTWWAMAKGGLLYRSKDGMTGFEEGPNPLGAIVQSMAKNKETHPRHVALKIIGDSMWVFYTNIGDSPERIFRSEIRMNDDWKSWKASAPEEILRPETEWEGAKLPLTVSKAGAAQEPENALRDPCVFSDNDERDYLLYSVAGEMGIAIAEILPNGSPKRKP